jgi:Spy/CpxP family protein refolding chaperone
MRPLLAILALFALLAPAFAQPQPYRGLDTRAIKTLSEKDIEDLNAGRGMGLALAAELNGYPGPIHAIELSGQLGLSAEQIDKLKGLYEAMKTEAIPLGSKLISQERELNEHFASQTVTAAVLEATTQQIGATHAALRATHLKYHLSTAAILTPAQVARYNELRGYTAGGSAPMHHHRMHQ